MGHTIPDIVACHYSIMSLIYNILSISYPFLNAPGILFLALTADMYWAYSSKSPR